MLELYELTSVQRYLDAAIKTGKMYTTSIYTHPIPSRDIKYLNGKKSGRLAIESGGVKL